MVQIKYNLIITVRQMKHEFYISFFFFFTKIGLFSLEKIVGFNV